MHAALVLLSENWARLTVLARKAALIHFYAMCAGRPNTTRIAGASCR
jgi:hypothetical protein